MSNDKILMSSEEEVTAQMYAGDAALEMFNTCLNSAFADDATGGAYGYRWAVSGTTPFNQVLEPTLTRIENPDELTLTDYNMVVIDSGNTHGDSWKYVYHTGLQVGTFMKEN